MNTPHSAASVVMVAVDDTPASLDATHTAARLASMLRTAELHLANVVTPVVIPIGDGTPATVTVPVGERLADARTLVAQLAATARADFAGRIVTHVALGGPVNEILQLSSDVGADVIVVGSHNRKTLERWLLGSVAEQVARKAPCSVIVARPKDYGSHVPEIEPPCPACLAVQKATNRQKLWCDQHDRHPVHGELHYELPRTFGLGSMFIRPQG